MTSKMELREFCTPPTVPLTCSSTPSCGWMQLIRLFSSISVSTIKRHIYSACLQYLCNAEVRNPESEACGRDSNKECQDGRSTRDIALIFWLALRWDVCLVVLLKCFNSPHHSLICKIEFKCQGQACADSTLDLNCVRLFLLRLYQLSNIARGPYLDAVCKHFAFFSHTVTKLLSAFRVPPPSPTHFSIAPKCKIKPQQFRLTI